MKPAFNVVWKLIALAVAGVFAAFVMIVLVAIVFGGGLGDPCPPYC